MHWFCLLSTAQYDAEARSHLQTVLKELSTKIVWKMKNSRNRCARRISLTWSSGRMLRTQKEQSRIQKNNWQVLQILALFLNFWLEPFIYLLWTIFYRIWKVEPLGIISRENSFLLYITYLLTWQILNLNIKSSLRYVVNALAFMISNLCKGTNLLNTYYVKSKFVIQNQSSKYKGIMNSEAMIFLKLYLRIIILLKATISWKSSKLFRYSNENSH